MVDVHKKMVGDSKLLVVDGISPEDVAMLQALYSRSSASAETHLEKVLAKGSGKFMDNYVVGYNHKSIADCGSTTAFIEGVSILMAKAIQDWPLYCGQETSTRYIDMSKQRIVDPVGTPESKAILDRWMDFYIRSQGPVAELVRAKHPQRPEEKDTDYARAVGARTFDILRGWLPAGITTQLSWHTNLRQAGDHLNLLTKHPSQEVQGISSVLRSLLHETYSSSGLDRNLASVTGVTSGAEEREAWEWMMMEKYAYQDTNGKPFQTTVRRSALTAYEGLLRTRPRGSVLPHFLSDLGQVSFAFSLDFGSFRDIQRHRNGVCRMPLLTLEEAFHPWYLAQLPEGVFLEGQKLLEEQEAAILNLKASPVDTQYYIALGYCVTCSVTYSLPAAVYVLEIRSAKTVHPTLRQTIHGMIRSFQSEFPEVPLHVDMDPDDWDVRRGVQTITEKK